MLVLGIDTSCDETAVSVVKNGKKVLSNVVFSSLKLHKKFGGVVPEIACRTHVEAVTYAIKRALTEAKAEFRDIDLIAVTFGPGLVGSLLVGISIAKSFSFAGNIPLIGINHLEAHLEGAFINRIRPNSPFVGLVVSGGHTCLVYNNGNYELLGRTRDDAAGEAFDKVAKILGLTYPGGPVIERLAEDGDPEKIRFPRSFLGRDSLDFSFSGVKTAVLYYVRDNLERQASGVMCQASGKSKQDFKRLKRTTQSARRTTHIADIAASFQEAVVDMLVTKTLLACKIKRVDKVVVGGGVAANSRLRKRLIGDAAELNIKVYYPSGQFCTDNAAMVAVLGYRRYKRYKKREISDLSLTAVPNLRFGE